uniref:Matrilin coiled-coil trimerisation domain-containing protein n=1 Tax=Cyanistes caeruleus TaxID=156563 RepID=A0A8C0UCG1_CYACU
MGCPEQHSSCSSLHQHRAAILLPVLPKFLLYIWEAQRKSCILGFAPSGLGAACWGVASAVLRVCPCHTGIVMFAVGVGKAVEEELRAIASEPVEQHFSYSADFTTMTHLVENFSLNICPEEGKGETEIRSPCECEALVQFQTNTVAILQSLTEKNILWGDAWACQGSEQQRTEHTWGREG